jgi:hypothetical protein
MTYPCSHAGVLALLMVQLFTRPSLSLRRRARATSRQGGRERRVLLCARTRCDSHFVEIHSAAAMYMLQSLSFPDLLQAHDRRKTKERAEIEGQGPRAQQTWIRRRNFAGRSVFAVAVRSLQLVTNPDIHFSYLFNCTLPCPHMGTPTSQLSQLLAVLAALRLSLRVRRSDIVDPYACVLSLFLNFLPLP